jgi:serine/threonine-protein kinase RsbW
MSAEFTLELEADMADLLRADRDVAEFAARMGWSEETLFQIRLVLEEVIVNVISYGCEPGRPARIVVHLQQEGGTLSMDISDTGLAFDPLQRPPPDLDAALEDRPIGGLGIHLIRTMMDSVSYRRDGEWNRLSVSKTLA